MLCSLPWGVLATGFVVNTTLLDSLGLSIPQTHEQFDSVCETLVENGYTPIQGFYEQIMNSIPDNYEGNILHFFEGETPFLCFSTEGFSGMKKRKSKSEAFMAEPFEYEFVSLPISSDEPVLSESFLPGLFCCFRQRWRGMGKGISEIYMQHRRA